VQPQLQQESGHCAQTRKVQPCLRFGRLCGPVRLLPAVGLLQLLLQGRLLLLHVCCQLPPALLHQGQNTCTAQLQARQSH
jgi:hypothetical protein